MDTSLTAEDQHAIIARRDAAYDGAFVFAVVTTYIYCRPSCPAPRPLPRNVIFFASAKLAQQACFRACKRCRPDEAPNTRLQQLVTALQQESPDLVGLESRAKQLSLSSRQLRRTLMAELGMGPVKVQQAARLQRAKLLLAESDLSIAGIAYEADFSSLRQFNRVFKAVFAVTPQEFRSLAASAQTPPISLKVIAVKTPVGLFHMIADGADVVRASGFGRLKELLPRLPAEARGIVPEFVKDHQYQRVIQRYFAGDRAALDAITRHQPGSVFQTQVWQALSDIDFGKPQSYAQVAARIGRPGAVRAVGTACGQNRLILLVPCHRVVKSNGSTGNYLYGAHIKNYLLRLEGDAPDGSMP